MTVPRHGVLIMGSGNLVHNLHAYAWGRHRRDPYEWAVRFETQAKEMMLAGQYQTLLPAGRDEITFPVEGVDGGSVSMLAVQVG
jgi:4,5-DOPA dioxygenase extradiol